MQDLLKGWIPMVVLVVVSRCEKFVVSHPLERQSKASDFLLGYSLKNIVRNSHFVLIGRFENPDGPED